MRSALLIPVLALSTACGGSDLEPEAPETTTETPSASEHEGTSHHEGDHHDDKAEGKHDHNFPGAVKTFHDALAPLWHAEANAERVEKVCAAINDLNKLAEGMAAEVPQGVEASAWQAKNEKLDMAVEGVLVACEQDRDVVNNKLKPLHEAFHAAIELLPKTP